LVRTIGSAGATAIVTGGAGGIGRAVVDRLTASGAQVWTLDIEPAELSGRSLRVDITRDDQVVEAVARVVAESGSLHIVVHCAGHLGGFQPFEELAPEEWSQIIATNLVGVLEVTRRTTPHLRAAGWGRIVTVGSLAGKHGLPNMAVYSAASAGVIAFTKALAQELADTGIRVNSVTPGPIDTELITRLGPRVVESMIASSPLKRLGTPGEVAELVAWLCSEAASFSTGAIFDVSGGRAAY
jgi:NAD(P)-dependent dehydrogenase (short-subunit alcohol dehydrogenase family)